MIQASWECAGCGARVDSGVCQYCGRLQPIDVKDGEEFVAGNILSIYEPYKTINADGIEIEVYLLSPGLSIIKGADGRVVRNVSGVREWVKGCGDIRRFCEFKT